MSGRGEGIAPLSRDQIGGAVRSDRAVLQVSAVLKGPSLETDEWSEGHPRIMVRAASEVDFIAGLKA